MRKPTNVPKKHPVPKSDAEDPLERIAAIQGRLAFWERDLQASVKVARDLGFTWREIGTALGVSPQAATLRFGPGGALDVETKRNRTKRS